MTKKSETAWDATKWREVITGKDPFTVIMQTFGPAVKGIVARIENDISHPLLKGQPLLDELPMKFLTAFERFKTETLDSAENPTGQVIKWMAIVIRREQLDRVRVHVMNDCLKEDSYQTLFAKAALKSLEHVLSEDRLLRDDALKEAISRLPPKSKNMMTCLLGGMTREDIMQAMNISSVATYYRRRDYAFAALKPILEICMEGKK